jgi:hypothetical protein
MFSCSIQIVTSGKGSKKYTPDVLFHPPATQRNATAATLAGPPPFFHTPSSLV